MKKIMPQELEVWYLIPALRKEFAKIFIKDYKLKQKEVAKYLRITEAAVSQYLKSKRGSEIKFSKEALAEIKKSAKEVIEKKEDMIKELYNLCISLKKSKAMCDFHRMQDKKIPKNCDVCLKN
jgi:uncharacterized protein